MTVFREAGRGPTGMTAISALTAHWFSLTKKSDMPLRVCIVALNAYPAIDPEAAGPIGGIETRAWTLARGLAQQPDLEVSLIVRNTTSLRSTNFAGVKLILWRDRLYSKRESLALRLQRTSGFPWFQLKMPRWDDLYTIPILVMERVWRGRINPLAPLKICGQVSADIFLTFGVQQISAQVIAAAHATGRKAILLLAHDGDQYESIQTHPEQVNTVGDSGTMRNWVLTHADRILCQTPAQFEAVRKLNLSATLFRNPIDLEDWSLVSLLPEREVSKPSGYALWVGRAERELKQPHKLIEMAAQCPEIDFLMILNRRDDAVEEEIRRSAPANVRIVERIPFHEMPDVFQRASVLVNTSSLEGFPNTFLQAAASGVPIASLNVEATFLEQSAAGWCSKGDLQALAKYVRACREGASAPFNAVRARQYLEDHHAASQQTLQLLALLKETIARDSQRQNLQPGI